MQIYNLINVIITDIKTILFDGGILTTLASLAVYIVLGYLSCAFIKEDFQFANGIPRMIIFSLLLGWVAIPLALVGLVFRACAKLIRWLFEM